MLALPGKTSNNPAVCLELEKKQTEPEVSKIKGIINNIAEISDIDKKTNFKRLTKLTWFFKKIKFKNPARQIKQKGAPKSAKL